MQQIILLCGEERKNIHLPRAQLKFISASDCCATMRWFILLAFIGVLLVKTVTPSKNQRHPSRLDWLFGSNNKQDENKKESKEENKQENNSTVCQSEECKKIARIISESMNKAVDPCDDFYEYACGNWPEHNPLPEGMDSWSMFESAQINVLKHVKEMFDKGPKDSDLLAVKLAKKWYAVCMDTDAMERHGLDPLVFTISRIGGWPLIMEPDEWNEQEYSWQKVDDQYVRLTGRNAFHDVRVAVYGSNETRKEIHIDTPHLPPGSYRLWGELDDSEEDESDEDPSDEEKQSDEQKDSQEPGSENNDDEESGDNSNDDNKSDNNDDDEDDNNDDEDDKDDDNNDDKDDDSDDENDDKDDDDDTNEQNDEDNAKKKVGMKKTGMKKTGKFAKNKKLEHSKKIKSRTHSKKHKIHKTKNERIKRRAILTIREKLRLRKNKRNHVKQERMEKLKKTLEATTPQISTKETIDEDNELKKFANYISKVARALAKARGVEVSEEHMNKDIQDMIEFHMKLVTITIEDSEDEKMALSDFQEWYDKKKSKTPNSAIDWLYKIGEIFVEAHAPIGSDLDLRVRSSDYFKNLVDLLDETSSRTIVNYIHWNFLSRIIRTTTSEMRKLYNAWEGEEENDDKETLGVPARSMQCVQEMKMSDILAYEYVRTHFSDEILTTASDMMDDIQKEVEYQIKKSDWMDEDTKDFVLAKLVNMNKFIGYPDWYKNNTIVKRYFQGLVISNSYYENTLSYDRYSKWKSLRGLLEKDEDDDEMLSPVMVNAFFSPLDNSIALSAADFQSPLFAYGRPQVINYGIIGSIMGHEVNHGFDDSGHLYDKNGDFVEWLSAMSEAYGKRAECFVEQFNNYPVDKASNYKIKNYGNQTAGENIADTMGLEAALRAYRRRERECGKPDTVLPGHEDVTNDQLFFLSFANLWCEAAETSNATINNAKSDVHSIGRLRVIGSISNSQDFAEAYNCPVGSAMNPEKKCHIWK